MAIFSQGDRARACGALAALALAGAGFWAPAHAQSDAAAADPAAICRSGTVANPADVVIQACRDAIFVDDIDPVVKSELHVAIADAYFADANYKRAIANYDVAIELTPENTAIFEKRARAAERSGSFSSAVENYTALLEQNPRQAQVLVDRADLLARERQFVAALADLTAAAALQPEDGSIRRRRAILLGRMGNYDAALADFGEAIRLNPSDHRALRNRGNVHFILEDFGAAIADYDAAVATGAGRSSTYFARAAAYDRVGRYDDALADYDLLMVFTPGNHSVHSERAWTLWLKGDNAEAMSEIEAAIAGARGAPAPYRLTRGHIRASMGDQEGALQDFEYAIRRGGRDTATEVQTALAEKGFDPGPIDGAYGGQTRTALTSCIAADCRLLAKPTVTIGEPQEERRGGGLGRILSIFD